MHVKHGHRIAGIIISIFVSLHLFNHLFSLAGAEKPIALMAVLRFFYRNIFAQTILLVCITFQVVSGLKLFIAQGLHVKTSLDKLQIWTGLYLAIFLIIHLSAVFAGRFLLHLDTNFYFGSAGLNYFPFNLFFIPYYGIAIFSFFGHIAAIHGKKIQQNIFDLSPNKQAIAILILGLIFTIILFYGLTNHFKGIEIPKEYEVLIGK